MRERQRWTIPATRVRSLVWNGDALLDPAAGWRRYELDGTATPARINYPYPFDSATVSPSGEFTALTSRLGTKGLILKGQQPIRELNRSYSYAHVFEYPLALFRLPDGREVVAHCPDRPSVLQLDELATGRRLTSRDTPPLDVFHSRLQSSPGGRFLLSAGWLWHPLEALLVYDVPRALEHPASLDSRGVFHHNYVGFEVEGAAFAPDGSLLVATSEPLDALDDDYLEFTSGLGPRRLARVSLRPAGARPAAGPTPTFLSQVTVSERLGTLMALDGYVVGFYDHPKLVDVRTGEVVARWPDLRTGRQAGSIIRGQGPLPPLALDPPRRRFAVAGPEHITVVQLG
ncbi:MAG TPA: hypothetical protein VH257_02795 [Chloroflexota bacterium]|nr:hypothetical protein [Chloroflexota bacterium]